MVVAVVSWNGGHGGGGFGGGEERGMAVAARGGGDRDPTTATITTITITNGDGMQRVRTFEKQYPQNKVQQMGGAHGRVYAIDGRTLEKPPNGDTPRSWSGTREREVGIWVVGKVWSERAVDESAIVAYTDALKC
ncbi:hypothetical protein Tco_1393067 [Tanacetum coccineum]